MQASYKPKNYRPEVDGLRSIAVLTVIFYHANIFPFSGGFVGVDIFFVISGYLITSILAKEMNAEKFTFLNFYERRFRRILPALFFVTVVSIAAALLISSPEQLKDFGQSVVATMGFMANIYFFLTSGYFSADVESLPFIHMWSLAVEEQFYVFFPIVMLLIFWLNKKWLQPIFILAFFISLLVCIGKQDSYQIANFYLTPFRAWELLTGALVATNMHRITPAIDSVSRLRSILEFAGLILIGIAVFSYTKYTPFPGWYAIPPVFGAALLIMASDGTSFIGKLLASRIAVGLGLLSYSAYLWHQPLFAFTRVYTAEEPSLLLYAGLIIITFILAWISWRYVEQPFRLKENYSQKAIFSFAIAGSGVFAAIGLMLHLNNGFPQRFDAQTLAVAETMTASPGREKCHTEGVDYMKPEDACQFNRGDANWAVLGDSHGVELGYELAQHLEPNGDSVLQLSFSGCQPALTFQTDNAGCHEWLNDSVKFIEENENITNVMLSFRHSFHMFGDQLKTYPGFPDQHPLFQHELDKDAARARYLDSYTQLVERLAASGKKVYLVDPIPELPVLVERYVYNYTDYSGDIGKPTGTTLEWFEKRNSRILSKHETLAKIQNVYRVPVASNFCDESQCVSIMDNVAMYFDDNHLSLAGAKKVIDNMAFADTDRK